MPDVALPALEFPTAWIRGLRLEVTADSSITVNTGEARDRDDEVDLVLGSSITVNPFQAFVAGTGGLDAGAEAADTWYAIHLVSNADRSQFSLLTSTSKTAPTMPSGQVYRRWLGMIRNDASSNLLQGEYVGERVTRWFNYRAEDLTATPFLVLSAGAATTNTQVSCAAVAPPQGEQVLVTGLNNSGAVQSRFRHAAEGLATIAHLLSTTVGLDTQFMRLYLSGAQEVTYQNSAGGGSTDMQVKAFSLHLDGSD